MVLLVNNYIYTKDKRCYVSSADEYYLQPARIIKTGRIYANPELREIYDQKKRSEEEFFSKKRSNYEIWRRKRRLRRQNSASSNSSRYRERGKMLRKQARVIEGEYQEWTEDEGPIQPTTQQEKSAEFQSELLPISIGRTPTKYSFSFTKQTGIRLA